jgi:hypothetical protein
MLAGIGTWRGGVKVAVTVELEELVRAGLRGELLGVLNGLLEGVALGGSHDDGIEKEVGD